MFRDEIFVSSTVFIGQSSTLCAVHAYHQRSILDNTEIKNCQIYCYYLCCKMNIYLYFRYCYYHYWLIFFHIVSFSFVIIFVTTSIIVRKPYLISSSLGVLILGAIILHHKILIFLSSLFFSNNLWITVQTTNTVIKQI